MLMYRLTSNGTSGYGRSTLDLNSFAGVPGFPTIAQWLAQELRSGQKVGVDGRLISIADFEDMKKKLSASSVSLMSVSKNLVDEIWKEGRPSLSNATIFPLEMKFTGELVTRGRFRNSPSISL
ncbi:PREDICTED: probable Xaa-Pro aminopeptidase P [Acropora digitifera]|uniref:probable Xaa-Pro aminopeptidase P n=1 Tax=Acropora digitifera TaxID=70779 RepID=UPI00077AACCA|nr:PREDICTED: probable Xaa-Pro aminopeptidase P [Acropora digitifera]